MGFDRKAYMQEYRKKHYADNREKYIEQATEWNKKNTWKRKKTTNSYYQRNKGKVLQRLRDNKRKAVEMFGEKCADCENSFPDCVYDFHHVNEDKEANPSVALRRSWENAVKELEKCIMICANCHRKRHFLNF